MEDVETLGGAARSLSENRPVAPSNVSTNCAVADITGILVVNKPAGLSSHGVVNRVRRIVGQKRIGHTGTLDPTATGVLVLCLGQATRIAEYVAEVGKVYRATVRLGVTTSTWDREGDITGQQDCSALTPEAIERALHAFVGTIQQVPPMFSALKHEGDPLYKLARRGLTVEREPRTVTIYALEVEAWRPPDLLLRVACSKGTYIRALAHDLGQALGVGAYLASLERLAVGPFTVEQAVDLDTLAAEGPDAWRRRVRPMRDALTHMPGVVVDAETLVRIRFGQLVALVPKPVAGYDQGLCCVFADDGALLAIARYEPDKVAWQPFKVFL